MKSLLIIGKSTALAVLVALGIPSGFAQHEVDPDHYDSPDTEAIPQRANVDGKIKVTRYNGTFSLPHSVLCNGKKLLPGRYAISLRSDGKTGEVILNQKGHAIKIASIVQTQTLKRGNEVVVVEHNETRRTLLLVRVHGLAFVFDPKHLQDPSPDSRHIRTEELPLAVTSNAIANPVPDQASPGLKK